jgi:phosphoserine phosphatase RsbU/P
MDPKPYLVLVVNDDSTVRKINAALLEDSGFRVVQASNRLEALNLLESTLNEAILLDVAIPGRTALASTRYSYAIRQWQASHIILVTRDDDADKSRYLACLEIG